MEFHELPGWVRIWIVLAFILLAVGMCACAILGVVETRDARNAAFRERTTVSARAVFLSDRNLMPERGQQNRAVGDPC